MVKSYLKYEFARSFGVISTAAANVVWTPDPAGQATSARATSGGRAVVGANEEVFVWDVKKGELLRRWRDTDCKHQVTAIVQSKTDVDVFAVGYDDGSIRVWDSATATVVVSFNGHRSAVTTLAFDSSGVRLASGSKDTDIIIWDLVAEVGLFRLRGHKDQVTALCWLRASNDSSDGDADGEEQGVANGDPDNARDGFLLTTGKDSLIKIWDIASQHCIETHVTQTNGECWAMSISPDYSGCVTAGNDGEMRVWSLDLKGLYERSTQVTTVPDNNFLAARGTLHRQSKDRAVGIHFHPRRDYFAVHGSEKAVEIWRIRSESEVQKTLARKRRRRREKEASKATDGSAGAEKPTTEADDPTAAITPDITDVFVLHAIVRTGGRVRSVDWAGRYSRKDLQLLVAATNNMLEYYRVADRSGQAKSKQDESPDYSRLFAVDMPGHRTDIRSLSLSNDNKMLASASNGSLKVWNVQSGTCIRTFECGYALCCSFLPGDRIVVVGNKGGELELYDVASATSIDSVKGHDGAIWTLRVHPDGRSMISGSADKTVKFWKFEITHEEVAGQKSPRLSLVHTRTLKGSDDILSVCFSPDGRLLALGLLDNTVKVFFVDSLKLYLNLYGHKLPVLSMDISHDSRLIVTCSADKNVRLWGLDFGDCHKAFFAHQDSIMQVAFVPHNRAGTGHHFFSASKDRLLKYWDGDKFEQIQKLDGHHGEIWALAISRAGEFVVTASHDRSMRVWEETDEPLFLEEEREKELEELYESTLTASLERDGGGGGDDGDGDDKTKAEVAAAGKQTVETLVTGERIIEALEAGMADLELLREWEAAAAARAPHEPRMAPPARNPLFAALGGISADEHVLGVLQKVRAAALHDALLILPFSLLPALLTFLGRFAAAQRSVPLTCRVLFFVLRTHHRQIVASKLMRPLLDGIRGHLRRALQRQKDEMGFNLAALRAISAQVRERGVRHFVDADGLGDGQDAHGKMKKRAFIDVA